MSTHRARFVLVPALGIVLASFAFGGFGALSVGCGPKKPPAPVEAPPAEDAGADTAPEPPPPPKSLFEKLGKKEGIAKVVDELVKNLVADPRVSKSFAKLSKDKVEKLKANLVDQICEVSGGDCKYAGKGMKEAHKGMKITTDQFAALVDDLKTSLQVNKVADEDIAELVGKLAPMQDDIVDPKTIKKK